MNNHAQTVKTISQKINAFAQHEIQRVADTTARWNIAVPMMADLMSDLASAGLSVELHRAHFFNPAMHIVLAEKADTKTARQVVEKWAEAHGFELMTWLYVDQELGWIYTEVEFDGKDLSRVDWFGIYIVTEQEVQGHGI